ncbi:acyl transferase [Nonlabens ponticola]|uniref:Acyl transferase n=2 Tax=Nonlabens ponticola TaxID=2496866 RepID=A0A3S9N157_9FLAO|nr:acyl transferase [Nonlabens ponticola]
MALEVFRFQFQNNQVYSRYCSLLGKELVDRIEDIPYLPISFFKTHQILSKPSNNKDVIFTSSGTTESVVSKHRVTDPLIYENSLDHSFKFQYGNYEDYVILALLPHYLERKGSSLVYMVQRWIEKSNDERSGFYLHNISELAQILKSLQQDDKKVILIGVTFALLQLAEQFPMSLPSTTIIETGGMKGMRKEIIKPELHRILKSAFNQVEIHSEYGMTELLSQAYANDGLHFETPEWMHVSARDTNDPLSTVPNGKTGGLNIIDLANYNSCSFIATQDLGKVYENGSFEVLGRFDHSDIRGCNLMAIN